VKHILLHIHGSLPTRVRFLSFSIFGRLSFRENWANESYREVNILKWDLCTHKRDLCVIWRNGFSHSERVVESLWVLQCVAVCCSVLQVKEMHAHVLKRDLHTDKRDLKTQKRPVNTQNRPTYNQSQKRHTYDLTECILSFILREVSRASAAYRDIFICLYKRHIHIETYSYVYWKKTCVFNKKKRVYSHQRPIYTQKHILPRASAA